MKKSSQDLALLKKLSERKTPTIAVDLDGTLASFSKWNGYDYIGAPIPETVKLIRKFKKEGAHIIIHSCRVTTADNQVYLKSVNRVTKWLINNKVPFDEIWLGTGKVFANIYVDDNAVNPHCHECVQRITK